MSINLAPDVTWKGDDVFQTTSFNIPRPASGISVGAFLQLGISMSNAQTADITVAGWTSFGTPTEKKGYIFWKIADATDASGSGNWVCTCDDGFIEQWAGQGWNGVNTSTPFATGPAFNTVAAGSTTINFTSQTSPGTGSVWVGMTALENNSSGITVDPTSPAVRNITSDSGFMDDNLCVGYSATVNSGAYAPSGTQGTA